MSESNRRRLERLEQMAHVSVGDARVDNSAAIELHAITLEAEIEAHRLLCQAFGKPGAFKGAGPDDARRRYMQTVQREQLARPLQIRQSYNALQMRVEVHGASPAVAEIMAKARRFLASAA